MIFKTIPITDEPEVTLSCYLLDSSERELSNLVQRPAVLIFPGGGYRICSDREAEPIALAYASQGWNAFVLRYSVGERARFPRPLREAEAAMNAIIENSEEWRVDTSRIAVVGFSAGGHLAAALGTMGSVKPSAMVLGYACILQDMSATLTVPVPGLEDKVDKTTPPTFLFATADDNVVPARNSLAFAGALGEAGVPYELHMFQSGAHGLSLANEVTCNSKAMLINPPVSRWFKMSTDWLRRLWGSQGE